MEARTEEKSTSNADSKAKMDRRALLQQWLLEKKKKKEEEKMQKKDIKSNKVLTTQPKITTKQTKIKTTQNPVTKSSTSTTKPRPPLLTRTKNTTSNSTSAKTTINQSVSKPLSKPVTKTISKQTAPRSIAKTSIPKPTAKKSEPVKSTKPTLTKPPIKEIKQTTKPNVNKGVTKTNTNTKSEMNRSTPKKNCNVDLPPKNSIPNSTTILEEEKNEIISSISNLRISEEYDKYNIEKDIDLESVDNSQPTEDCVKDKIEDCKPQVSLDQEHIDTNIKNDTPSNDSQINDDNCMEFVTPEKSKESCVDETPEDNNNLLLFPFLKNSQGESEQGNMPKLVEQTPKTPRFTNTHQFTTPRFKFFSSMTTPSKPTSNDVESSEDTSEESLPSSIIVLEKMRAGKNKEILGSDYVVTPVRRSARFLKGTTPNETLLNTRKLLAESNWAYSPNVALKNVSIPTFKAPPSTTMKTNTSRWRRSLMCPQTDIKNNFRSKINEMTNDENTDNNKPDETSKSTKKEKKKHRNSECLEFRRVQYSSSYGSTYVIQDQSSESEDFMVTPVRRSRRILRESAQKVNL